MDLAKILLQSSLKYHQKKQFSLQSFLNKLEPGMGFEESLDLILYIFFIDSLLYGLHPIPYTVSVGKMATPP